MFLAMLLAGSVALARPELTIAQGLEEANLNPYAVGRAGEKGAYQVKEEHWGKVPKRLPEQMQQNEKIMDELLRASNGDLRKALAKYNGKGPKARAYAKRVVKRTICVAMLGR